MKIINKKEPFETPFSLTLSPPMGPEPAPSYAPLYLLVAGKYHRTQISLTPSCSFQEPNSPSSTPHIFFLLIPKAQNLVYLNNLIAPQKNNPIITDRRGTWSGLYKCKDKKKVKNKNMSVRKIVEHLPNELLLEPGKRLRCVEGEGKIQNI